MAKKRADPDRQQTTAWNLYRAWRTYPEAERAIANARAACGIAVPVDDDLSRIMDTIHGYARYIAAKHNFDTQNMINCLSKAGIHLFSQSVTWEIVGEPLQTMPSLISQEYFAHPFYKLVEEPLKVIDFGFEESLLRTKNYLGDPYITIHPLAFGDIPKLMDFIDRELPHLVARLLKEWTASQNRYIGLEKLAAPSPKGWQPDVVREGSISLDVLWREAGWWAMYMADRLSMPRIAEMHDKTMGNDSGTTDTKTVSTAIGGLEERHLVTRPAERRGAKGVEQ